MENNKWQLMGITEIETSNSQFSKQVYLSYKNQISNRYYQYCLSTEFSNQIPIRYDIFKMI